MQPPPPASPVLLSSMPSDFPFFLHFPVLFSCTNHISFTPGFPLRQSFPCTNRSLAPFPRTSRPSPLSPAPFPRTSRSPAPSPKSPSPARFPFPETGRPGHSRAGCHPASPDTVPPIGGTVPAGQATGPAVAGPEPRPPPPAFAAGEFAGGSGSPADRPAEPCRRSAAPHTVPPNRAAPYQAAPHTGPAIAGTIPRAANRRHHIPCRPIGRKAKDAHRRPQKPAPMPGRRRLAAPECRRPIGRR